MDFPGGSDGKESACSAGDLGSSPGLGRSPGEGTGYPLQYSHLENSVNKTSGLLGFVPGSSDGKESACNAGDLGSILGLGRSSGEGKVNSLQYPALGISMDCIVHGGTKCRRGLSGFH